MPALDAPRSSWLKLDNKHPPMLLFKNTPYLEDATMRSTFFASLLLVALMPSTTSFAETRQVTREMRSGEVVRIAVHSIYGSDCRGTLKPVIIMRQEPSSGTVSVRGSMEEVRRGDCAGRQIPGMGVFYQSRPGFTGRDRVIYQRGDHNGRPLWTVDATIIVR